MRCISRDRPSAPVAQPPDRSTAGSGTPPRRIRVLAVIARTNVGGPAHHVGLLTGRLDPDRYASLLVSGSLGRGEASFDTVIDRFGARRQLVPELGPELHPGRDAQALRSLVRVMRRYRPAIVHTHTAKAGTLGRIAARVALGPRPVVVHTYHGHVLRRYFGPLKTEVFRTMERALARVSDCLIGVSQRPSTTGRLGNRAERPLPRGTSRPRSRAVPTTRPRRSWDGLPPRARSCRRRNPPGLLGPARPHQAGGCAPERCGLGTL